MGESLGARLLRWFEGAARDLPWRGRFPRDPYRVLVSEIMLQQTQVARVVDCYARFLTRFPTLDALAAAAEDEVLKAFSGLGYYRRARSLHAAAGALAARGSWPTTRAALRELPGFGAYTSAAVAAFAFGGADPLVDGNAGRVAARLRGLELHAGSRALIDASATLGRELWSDVGTPEVWEALMELGATVCTPSAPRCSECPWQAGCLALRDGRQETLPLPRPTRPTERHRWVAAWLVREGKVLLERIDGPLLRGLWLPPFQAIEADADPGAVARALARARGYGGELRRFESITHTITHRRIEVLPFGGVWDDVAVAEPGANVRWETIGDAGVATSSLLPKLASACAGLSSALRSPTSPAREE